MKISSLWERREQLISIDIGASAIKLVELDLTGQKPRLVNIGSRPLDGEIFSNNVIVKKEQVSEELSALLEEKGIDDKRVVTCVPGPTVFTKKIKTPQLPYAELVANVQIEATNFIPHNIDAVKLDFHILREVGKGHYELLVVAVKNEVLDALIDTISLAGLEVAVIDVDYFGLQNIFEHSYPEFVSSTVALVDFGARYSSVNIVQSGLSLFTGDVNAGSRGVVDAVKGSLQIGKADAELLLAKGTLEKSGIDSSSASAVLESQVQNLAKEFNRQLSFFWSAAGSEQGIDRIVLTGGAARMSGFLPALEEVTGLPCELLDPFKRIEIGEGIEKKDVEQLRASIGVACGMGLREPGDRILPEDLE